ncbi:MAG TPA: FAD-binding protein [Bacillota bacterium]
MADDRAGIPLDRLASRLAGMLGREAVSTSGQALIVRPVDEDGIAAALTLLGDVGHDASDGGCLASHGGCLTIRGRGSKAWWDDLPAPSPIVLDTTGLRAGLRHDAGDLVASVPTGLGWAEVQDQLGREGQWIPLDPPLAEHASVGGVVGAATSGPRRTAYGAVRDLVIGARAVLPGGRVIQAGGRVIKNVAGYDLCKLLVGSFGSLAALTEVTFKVLPLPDCRGSVTAEFDDVEAAHGAALAVLGSVLEPAAVQIVWCDGRPRVRVDVDGVERVVARQLRDLRELLVRRRALEPDGGLEAPSPGTAPTSVGVQVEGPLPVSGHRDLLGAVEAAQVPSRSAVVRVGVPAARLAGAWPAVNQHLGPLDGRPLRADVAAGLMWWVLPNAELVADAVAALDAALRPLRGYATLEAGPAPALLRLADHRAGSLTLSRRIKAIFDPRNLLCSPRLGA